MKINNSFFFNYIRQHLFGGKLRQSQVDGLNILLNYWNNNFTDKDPRWLAYTLATVHHEVDKKFKPIKEYGNKKRFHDLYDINGHRKNVARRLGNKYSGDGIKFHGRGFVQLTGRDNYSRWKEKLNIDILTNPDLVLEINIATEILFQGMHSGSFTGKKFSDYFNSTKEDWINARRIINGKDKANLIADYAKNYYAAISFKP